MSSPALYPLRFEPLYQYRLWGGRQLDDILGASFPSDGCIGEAWVLSDRDDHPSRVANGPLRGRTIGQLIEESPQSMMGRSGQRLRRFPLLLKFLDAHQLLSVQVHPSDAQTDLLPAGETGKTEGWVVLKAGTESRIYAGLRANTTADGLRRALANAAVTDRLASFTPKPGDAVLLPAGTVHSLGGDTVVFEVQQNSDVTFRLYDWDRVDAQTGRARALQVDQALACIDFTRGPVSPVTPFAVDGVAGRERLFRCPHFSLWRQQGRPPWTVGAEGLPRILVCVEGTGQVEHDGTSYGVGKGDVWLLPAAVGACDFRSTAAVTLLELALPE